MTPTERLREQLTDYNVQWEAVGTGAIADLLTAIPARDGRIVIREESNGFSVHNLTLRQALTVGVMLA